MTFSFHRCTLAATSASIQAGACSVGLSGICPVSSHSSNQVDWRLLECVSRVCPCLLLHLERKSLYILIIIAVDISGTTLSEAFSLTVTLQTVPQRAVMNQLSVRLPYCVSRSASEMAPSARFVSKKPMVDLPAASGGVPPERMLRLGGMERMEPVA